MFVFAVKLWDLPGNLANSNCSSSKGAEPCPYGAQSSAVVEGYRIPILVKRRSVLQGTNSRGTKKSKLMYVLPLGGLDLEADSGFIADPNPVFDFDGQDTVGEHGEIY